MMVYFWHRDLNYKLNIVIILQQLPLYKLSDAFSSVLFFCTVFVIEPEVLLSITPDRSRDITMICDKKYALSLYSIVFINSYAYNFQIHNNILLIMYIEELIILNWALPFQLQLLFQMLHCILLQQWSFFCYISLT